VNFFVAGVVDPGSGLDEAAYNHRQQSGSYTQTMPNRPLLRIVAIIIALLATSLLHAAESPIATGASPAKLSSDFEFTEGPATDREGNVYFTDQPNDRIVRYGIDGKLTDWLKPAGRSNGTYFDRDGNLITCADEKNQLWSISTDKKITVLIKDFDGKLLNGPNDLWIAPNGNLFFTDPLYKRNYWTRDPAVQQPGEFVYYLDRKTGAVRVAERELKKPNGIIGAPDGKTLYVADIGAKKTYAYDIGADGMLSGKRLFCEMGSDGMTIDAEGNVYLTGKGVTVFNSRGEQIEHIDIPESWTANITFGGKDRKTLFITASKSVYTVQMRVSGAK
jgi:gluconolactonase